ncbi:Pentatricopeptide repeat [Thalictrum thalictroides]|uniref:Pentatricopeptide repeat n=1 Tax=Thalictrum thalictroides TaxID=46969 RepID=A0A7J6URJ4_THATH|nr:Pentatricopeptide repeat [Thalictrum thalictroides]
MPERNIVTWTCLISGYTQKKMPEEACFLFCSMISEGFFPTHYTLGSAFRACQDLGPIGLDFAMQIHGLVSKTRYVSDNVVCNALMTMYGVCCLDTTEYARQVFDQIPIRNSISWNSMISVYSQRRDVFSSVELLSGMRRESLKPNEYTFGSLITVTYTSGSDSSLLEQMLNYVMKSGFLSDLYVGSALVSGFARFGMLDTSKMIFKQMGDRNAVSMNGLMVGLVKQKRGVEAAEVFKETRDLFGLNYDSYVVLLSACAEFASSEEGRKKGREIHAFLYRKGLHIVKVAIGNGLVNMYAKCGAIGDASTAFKLMVDRDLVSWNTMISGLDQNGCFEEALITFCRMRRCGIIPSNFTLISMLSSCTSLSSLSLGSQVHCEGIKLGLDLDVSVSNSLIVLYAECEYLSECQKVFAFISAYDLISWNSIIGALAKSEASVAEAIDYFLNMLRAGWSLNRVTFLNLLTAVSSLSILELGRQVHALVLKYCLEDDNAVANVLISFYGKCGEMDDCEKIFANMDERRDEVTWNSLISGYIHNGLFSKAMDLVWFMMQKGQRPDVFTFATVLSASASVATLERGMEIHACGIRACLESDVVVGSTLVDMYSKCGRIDYASKVFRLMPVKNDFSWNSMISGYARHGHGEKALEIFKEMCKEGQAPDHVTFVGVLSACSHVGLVNQGLDHFESMSNKYGLIPRLEHYSCMVDLLGRAGKLDKVEEFIRRMPMKPNVLVWRTVVGACCRVNGCNTSLGRQAAEMLLELEPQNAVNYVLLSNLYASGGRWEDVARSRAALRKVAVKKEAGCSWVTMKDGVHVFAAGDKSHPNTEEIYAKLRELNKKMRDAGYVPLTKYALYDLEVENKEELLSQHSEKLAVAFVLIRTSELPIRIMKNLRVCGDCHSAFGYISKIIGRQIVLRDSIRFHHFVDGKCSCGDYW